MSSIPRIASRQMCLSSRAFTSPALPSSSSSATSPLASSASPSSRQASSVNSSSESAQSYKIPRTASGELPVYSKLRRGNMWKTVVRNVEGDVGSLQAELNTLFQQTHIDPLRPAPVVTVRPTNQHLEVKGRWVPQVKEWLEGRGF